MRAMKEICFFAMIVLISMPAASSVAALTSLYSLPDSTFAAQQNNWQGRKTYDEGTGDARLNILVEFCVYDTENLLKTGEKQLVDALNLSGRYIYAYQIWNHPTESKKELTTFQLLNDDGNEIHDAAFKNDTGCYDDGTNGVAPAPKVSTLQGAWTFTPGDLTPGNHSWFLVFSSDNAPTKGDFTVTPSSGADLPVSHNPEPGTVALLGVGSGLFAARRKKERRVA
jgi:hypothetical protein